MNKQLLVVGVAVLALIWFYSGSYSGFYSASNAEEEAKKEVLTKQEYKSLEP